MRTLHINCCSWALIWAAMAASATAQPAGEGEGTLPGVVVTPKDEPEEEPLDPVEVTPQQDDPQPDDPQPNNSLSYPSLADQIFGQTPPFNDNTGVLRGTGNIMDSPRAVAIVRREAIARKQASTMFQALQNEVGVLLQSTAAGQASPFVRGLTGQQVLLLVDGIRMNNSVYRFGPNQYFNTIDPGAVDHIEVIRGTASVLWGSDAIGGAINVVMRGPDLDHALRCGDYGGAEFTQYYNTSNSSPYSRLNVEGWLGQAGVFAGGSFANVGNIDTGWDFGRQPGTNYQQFAGDMKFNYLIDDNQMLTLGLQHHEQEDLPRSDRFPGYPGDINGSNNFGNARFFDPQQRDLAYLRYQAVEPCAWLDALTVTGSFHRQREIQTRGVPTVRSQETDVETVGVNVVGSRDLGILGRLSSGVDWYYDHVDSRFGGTASGPIIPDDSTYNRFGVFLNWDVALTDRLNAVAGVRWEQINARSVPIVDVGGVPTAIPIDPYFSDWVAQVGLEYEINPCWALVGSISEGFRAPNLDELAGNNPNVLQGGMDLPSLGLTPEHSINYELGVKMDYERLRTQTFVFWNDLQDNIVPIAAALPNQFTRANQDSYIQGVEFNGEYLLQDGWSVYGNFWYIYGRNQITGGPLSRIPPTQGIAGLRWRDDDLNSYFALYTWLVRRQDRLDPVRDIGDERIPAGGTPGYGTLNLRAGTALGSYDQHRLSLSLENLLDKAYLVHGSGVFGTGFTARFGYSWVY